MGSAQTNPSGEPWQLTFTKRALKDLETLRRSPLRDRAKELVEILREDPFRTPPPFETPGGDFSGAYSRRINIQHRLVYEVSRELRMVKIISMWTHYE